MSYKNIFKINDLVSNSNKNNDYRIIKRLGNGGSGDAYLCIATKGDYSGCYFVIKFFYNINLEDRLKRFKKEIEFLKYANHPSIVKFYDDGSHIYKDKEKNKNVEFPYYIMEYMPNNLKKELSKGKLKIEKAFLYSTQLLSALCYMKSKGVLHRDIKPENIFINGSKAILGDFGLIKDINDSSTSDEDIESVEDSIFSSISNGDAMPMQHRSPHLVAYMNEKKPLTYNSDTFQMGIVIMMMFTGKNPLKHCREKSDPVEFSAPIHEFFHELNRLDNGKYIVYLILEMVNLDDSKIKECEILLNKAMLNYMNYLKVRDRLDGDIFF